MQVTPVTPELLVAEITELVAARSGRVRLAVDGPPPTNPRALADAVAVELRARGRATIVVDAADYLRPASLRLELGRTDPDMFLDGWLDVGGLRREVLEPAAPGGSGRVLPRLWDADADRAHRDAYVDAARGRRGRALRRAAAGPGAAPRRGGAPADDREGVGPPVTGRAAVDAPGVYTRYAAENTPEENADLVVLADHPDRPAIRR